MATNNGKSTDQPKNNQKPEPNANAHHVPADHANEANHKGAVDLGTDGTKATASQQQGQGSWNAKDTNDQEKNT